MGEEEPRANPDSSSLPTSPISVHVHASLEGKEGRRSGSPGSSRRTDKGGARGLPLVVFLSDSLAREYKKVDPKCPNASNPFHVCAGYCISKIAEGDRHQGHRSPLALLSPRSSSSSSREGNDVKLGQNRKEDFRRTTGPDPSHERASHHEHQHHATSRSVPGTPVTGGLAGEFRKVDPNCVNASNPYHVCTNYCFKGNDVKWEENRKVNPSHANASDPPHEHANHRKDPPHTNQLVPGTPEGDGVKLGENRKTDPGHSNSSDPSHEHANHHDDPPHANRSVPGTPVKDGWHGAYKKVDPNCVNATTPYHVCTDYCFSKLALADRLEGHRSPADRLEGHRSPTSPFSLHSSLPSREGNGVELGENSNADPKCANASNPPHEYADHYDDSSHETEQSEPRISALEFLFPLGDNRRADPKCANASNPPHEYANKSEDLSYETNRSEPRAPVENGMKNRKFTLHENLSEGSTSSAVDSKIGENRKVDPKCIYASNPYHVCADYCFKGTTENVQSPRVKPGNVRPPRVKPASAGRKHTGAVATVERRDVLPDCVNASNPYHKCGDYCKKMHTG